MKDDVPATKEDLEKAKREILEHIREGMEGFRQQQSAEHGTLFSRLTYITEMMVWLKTKWERFTRHSTWPGDSR